MAIVKQAWTSREPFDHAGAHYTFADFVSDVFPVQVPRPRLSFGGSSPAAYRVGGAEADIYCLWGEPLASTAEQIESVKAAARAAGRGDVPKIQVAFRPIIAPTEEKAHDIVRRVEDRVAANSGALSRRRPLKNPENTGSQRCWPSRPRASGSTARCGPGPPRSPAAPATPTPWSARAGASRRRLTLGLRRPPSRSRPGPRARRAPPAPCWANARGPPNGQVSSGRMECRKGRRLSRRQGRRTSLSSRSCGCGRRTRVGSGTGGSPRGARRGETVRLAGAASRTRRRILLVPSWVQAAPNALRAAAGAHSIGHLMAPQKPEVGEATPRSAIRCRDSVSGRSWPAGRPAATNGSHMLR